MDKWIKLSMSVFENRKIKRLLAMPDGDHLVIIWFKLLCLAGKLADGGLVYFLKDEEYLDEDLAFAIEENSETLRRALSLFERLSMIVITENGIPRVKNFSDFQSIEELRAIREGAKNTKRFLRIERRAELSSEKERADGAESKEINIIKEHIKQDQIRGEREKIEAASDSPPKTPHGEHKNVMISDDFLNKLREKHGEGADEMVEKLSLYMASTGAEYANHEATLCLWLLRDANQAAKSAVPNYSAKSGKGGNKERFGNFDASDAFNLAMERSLKLCDSDSKEKPPA